MFGLYMSELLYNGLKGNEYAWLEGCMSCEWWTWMNLARYNHGMVGYESGMIMRWADIW